MVGNGFGEELQGVGSEVATLHAIQWVVANIPLVYLSVKKGQR